ncbi:AmmeMemoRadiSam system radical SAM enzyme [candidate division KSB1 bacterium]|nr:MAG: AmmeMemoRadiSam system radical SAM enzyme [candidate division KSB1 bacterium]
MIEGKFYKREKDRLVCELCPRYCRLKNGQEGFCFGRENKNGKMVVTNYGRIPSLGLDPIEKKPLYHFYPSKMILSTGPNGCNLRCKFCQNWQISQTKVKTEYVSPDSLVSIAINRGSIGIAYTYSEPFIWYEFVYDCSKLAREKGLKNVLVTNGFINEKPLLEILPYIDAMNIDLKSITPEFYKEYCLGNLEDVQRTIKISFGKCHIELTNLLITDLNDDKKEITDLINWISNISDEIPLHISRYFPAYKMHKPATDPKKLYNFYLMAKKKLKYVYLGNVYIENTGNTYCPSCNNLLILREGYITEIKGIAGNKCKKCGEKIYGEFSLI